MKIKPSLNSHYTKTYKAFPQKCKILVSVTKLMIKDSRDRKALWEEYMLLIPAQGSFRLFST